MTQPEAEFDVTSERVDGARVVRVSGELDLATHERLGDQLALAAKGNDPIIVDLSKCEFIDSSGIRALLVGARNAGEEDAQAGTGRLSIAGPAPQVRRIVEITGLQKAVPVHDTLEAALDSLA